ncbi:MAG: hypothetical protein WA213_21045 [Terriglobales bacterium]
MPEFTDDIKLQIARMFNDVYFGNGKPAITVRLERGENRMKAIETQVDGMTKHVEAMRSFGRNVMIASIGSAVAVVGTLLADMLVKHWR